MEDATLSAIPVYFLLRDNTLALDLTGPAEVLRYANRLGEQRWGRPYFSLHYVSAEPSVSTSIGLSLAGLDPLPASLPDDAVVVVVGCEGQDDDFSSAPARAMADWLRRHVRPAHRLICICTGALFAGHAGLLDGVQCTTHHAHYDDLRRIAPRALVQENRIFVEDGRACTSAGVTTGIDLALHLVCRVAGYQVSATIAQAMVVYLRRGGGDPQLSPWLSFRNHIHPAVHRVQDAVSADPARDWTNAQLAQVACTSERHLTRLFREHAGIGLVDYINRIRIALARELLTQSQLDMERVAERAGFNSGRQLRRVWSRVEGVPPSAIRAAASHKGAGSRVAG